MEKALYGYNASQDVIDLQTKYSLFGRVANIVFSTEMESGFNKELMTEAINKIIERNDCLRITFVKKNKKAYQYFEDSRTIGDIPVKKFELEGQKVKFLHDFRRNPLKIYKGEVLKVVYATEMNGNQSIYFKISHFVADTYGIGVIVADLFRAYDALKNGKPLPPAEGSFETVLQKDLAYKDNEEQKAKDLKFFEEYYEVRHPDRPIYCGLHGFGSDRWTKEMRKGNISVPYLFVKCDTEGYKFTIPAAVGRRVRQWCEETGFPPSSFYFNTCNIAASLINGKQKHLTPLMLLDCRGTAVERKSGGSKVQAISVYATVDYSKSFMDNIKEAYDDQSDLFKHTKLSHLEVEALQHKHWNYSMLSQVINFSFSFIPFDLPEGVHFQVHSNGKGALVAYIALMANPKTDEIDVVYDVQTKMITGPQLVEFQNTYVRVIESVLADPDKPMGEILG